MRRTIDVLAAISLLLAAAVVAIWASHALPRAFWLNFGVRAIESEREVLWIGTDANMLVIDTAQRRATPIVGPHTSNGPGWIAFQKEFPATTDVSILRFKARAGPIFSTGTYGVRLMVGTQATYLIPFGLLIFVFGLLPAWRWTPAVVRSVRRRFVTPGGCCKTCGYDLRATPGRCPECGTVPASA